MSCDHRAAVLPTRTAYPDKTAHYPCILAGLGPYLRAEDERVYFDAACGSGSLIFGHGDQALSEVLAAQAAKLTLFPSRSFGVEIVERYLHALCDFAPAGLDRAATFSSGSDAVEAALKLAIQFHHISGQPRRTKVIGRRGSYHGNAFGGLSAGAFLSRRRPFEAALTATGRASSAHCAACEFGMTSDACAVDCVQSVERAICDADPGTVAAVVVEPVVGAALSAAPPDERYMPRLREICDRYGVLLIFDEVMTGFGRTGVRFAGELWDVVPDILICGKGISAGYFPLSAIITTGRVAEVFEGPRGPFQNGHTHACSPLGAAVGLAVIERLQSDGLLANAARAGATLKEGLRGLEPEGVIANVRGEGLMIGFDVLPQPTRALWQPGQLQQAALERGLIIYGSQGGAMSEGGEHAMLLPPLTITDEDVSVIVTALAAACRDVAAGARPC